MYKPTTCLVNVPHPYLKNPKAQAPIGLLYIAASIREKGFPVEFVDLSDKNFQDDFEIPEAEIYGITGTVLDRTSCEAVAKYIRKHQPRSRIILGGPITISPEVLDRSLFDSLFVGEGEEYFMRVISDFPNLAHKYIAPRILNLDSLPWPARDLLDGQLGGDVFANRKTYFEGGSTVVVMSRGCPFKCSFCASPSLWKRKVTYRNADSVADELQHVIDTYGVRQFRFSDDNLTNSKERLTQFCDRLKGMEIAWRASIRVKPNTIRMFRMMKDAGCTEVCFGIESGDPAVLHCLDKSATVADNKEAILSAKMAGLDVRVLFMTGVPGETQQTTDLNIQFLESLKDHFDTVALTNYVPLPGTPIANYPEKFGCEILDRDVDKFNLCMYGSDGSENEWPNLVRPVGLTIEQLTASKRAMRDYVISIGKSNKG